MVATTTTGESYLNVIAWHNGIHVFLPSLFRLCIHTLEPIIIEVPESPLPELLAFCVTNLLS